MKAFNSQPSVLSRRSVLVGAGAGSLLTSARGSIAQTRPTNQAAIPFFRGMNFGYLSKQGFFGSDAALAQAPLMKAAGVTWVSLLVMIMQDTYHSTRVYRDFPYTPDDLELVGIIRAFRAAGLKVILKPQLDVHDSTWRGRISFPEGDEQIQGVRTDYWTPSFDSMRRAVLYYARIAEAEGCEGFTLAQELYGTDAQTARWLDTVAAARETYSGTLLVNIDGRSVRAEPINPAMVGWIRSLDAVGVSFYPSPGLPGSPSVTEIRRALEPERLRLARMAAVIGRPMYFAEFGARSVDWAMMSTGEYRNLGLYDGQVQANYIQAVFETFWNEPWWIGFQLSKWDEQQDRPHYRQPDGDAGFQVAGKPAERVLAEWASRPDPVRR